MSRFFNSESLWLQDRLGYNSASQGFTLKRRDVPELPILFLRNDQKPYDPSPVSALTSFKWGAKLAGRLGDDYIVSNYNGTTFPVTKTNASRFSDAATTNASAVLTSATAVFTSADIGLRISGAGIPANATIIAVASPTSINLSANATATGANVTVNIAARLTTFTVRPNINSIELSDALIVGTIGQTVANQAARYALSSKAVGFIVKQTDTSTYWIVINASQLANATGWDQAPEFDQVALKGEIEVNDGTSIFSTLFFDLTIQNDVNRGNEGVPISANPAYPLPATIITDAILASSLATSLLPLNSKINAALVGF